LSPTNLVAVTISYEWPGGGYTSSDYTENLVEGAVATPTALLLPAGATFNIVCSDVSLMYGDAWVYGQMVYQGCVWQDPSTDTLASSFFDAGGETAPGYIGANNPWVIATAVPEPGTLTLLVSALLGLVGAFCLRRRRAKA
jgi:hypothetical protein